MKTFAGFLHLIGYSYRYGRRELGTPRRRALKIAVQAAWLTQYGNVWK